MARRYKETALDPTVNVKETLKQAVRRQDDLRRVAHNGLRNEVSLEVKGIQREIKDFKAYIKKINHSESKRIDAIRAVDQGNVTVASSAAELRAQTLATQVTETAQAANVALKAETDPIRKSIDDLRQSQWTIAGGTAQGREHTGEERAKSASWGTWVGIAAAILFGLTGILFNTLMFLIALYFGLRN